MLGAMIQMYIGAAYEGGIKKFDTDFNLFITPAGEVIFAPKNETRLTEDFISKLGEMAEGMGFKPYYAESSNFEGQEEEEVQEYLNESLRERLQGFGGEVRIQVNAALFDVLATDLEMDSERGQALINNLKDIRGVVNLRVEFSDETYMSIPCDGAEEEQPEVEYKYSRLSTGRPDRDTIISQDDHMNLQIALGQTNSVDEFIAMI